MSELLIPKPQPNFPHEDVNEANAQIFKQLLFDSAYIFNAHAYAEEMVEAFNIGHSTINKLSNVVKGSYEQKCSLSFGATIYEALSLTVLPTERQIVSSIHVGQVASRLFALQDNPLTMMVHMLDEEELFKNEMPVAAELVEIATELSPTIDNRLAVIGAALERSIERDTTDAPA
jgi:hypothetical protein